jgi:hypothetical protein
MPSPILGPAGNVEFLLHAVAPGDANAPANAQANALDDEPALVGNGIGSLADEAIKSVPERH